jgi:hypothetical protein
MLESNYQMVNNNFTQDSNALLKALKTLYFSNKIAQVCGIHLQTNQLMLVGLVGWHPCPQGPVGRDGIPMSAIQN